MDQRTLKRQSLREQGALYSKSDSVRDPLFHGNDFFDPHDLVLVKYEMLRRVQIEGCSVTDAVLRFGFSRMAFYQTLATYRRGGLPALIPRKRGPKQPHKLTAAIMAFIVEQRVANLECSAAKIAELVRQRFGLVIHRRSIERALAMVAKRGRRRSTQ